MSASPSASSSPVPIPPSHAVLPRSFYERRTEVVARELIGKCLARQIEGEWVGGWIVETEAYLADGDLASHSARGRTPSNASMFGPPGTLYVYPIHAKHCLNAVTESSGVGAAVLIRALRPVWGIDVMRRNRGRDSLRELVRGPAMICQTLDIDREHDGIDLVGLGPLRIAASERSPPSDVKATTRVGIRRSAELPLRFLARGDPFVSGRVVDRA